MNEYLVSPVTMIVLLVIAATAVIAIVITIRSNHRKERAWQEERRAMEERVNKRIAAEREGRDKARHAAPRPAPAPRRAKVNQHKGAEAPLPSRTRRSPGSVQRSQPISRKPESVPAPGHTGFRTDRDPVYNDTTSALIATGILMDYEPHDHGSRNDSPSYDPSPSPSYDSGSSSSSSSYDSGSSSSSSSDSGGSFDSGSSGSF